uniref:Putative toxin-antitoxin system protein n=1 Tax=termite gut metagenome TaxID=433724 RepID=S0DD98_9ZZZZ
MAALNISPEALVDLQEIKKYITDELDNPIAAKRITAEIIKAMRRLKTFPNSGAPLSPHVVIQTDYRFLVCGNYLVFYRYNGKTAMVARILHGRRDYLAVLFHDLPQREMES